MALHNAQPVGEIHQAHNWVVADSTARLALTLVAADIGKLCKQTDTGDFYILSNNVGPVWKNTSGGAYDFLSTLSTAEISVTAAATLTLNRMHVCSGTTADYAATLPAASGNAGKIIGIRIASTCTRWITLTGNAAELIDGSNTRRMWAKETAILMCDGTGWIKLAGKTIPLRAAAYRSSSFSVPAAAWTIIPISTVVHDIASGLATPLVDTTNGRIRCLRAGSYSLHGFVSGTGYAAGRLMAGGAMMGNGTNATPAEPEAWAAGIAPTASTTVTGLVYGQGSSIVQATTADLFYLSSYQDDTVARNTNSGASTRPSISITEIPEW